VRQARAPIVHLLILAASTGHAQSSADTLTEWHSLRPDAINQAQLTDPVHKETVRQMNEAKRYNEFRMV